MTKQTDAQWASTAVRNRQARDRRRLYRANDPDFRAREAAASAKYRTTHGTTHGKPPIEALRCSCCETYWHRIRRPGEKPRTCPPCRGLEKIWCPLCQGHWRRPKGKLGPKPISCPAHREEAHRAAATAEQKRRRAETRWPVQRLVCKQCGGRWKRPRPAKPCGVPHRCPECR